MKILLEIGNFIHMPDKPKNIPGSYNFKPNKLLGQNFLADKNILEKIISAAEISKNDTILEIGPGLGALTQRMGERAGKIIAIEKDKQLAQALKRKFEDKNNVEIIEGDILNFLKNSDLFKNSEIKNYKIVANIPYYLTSHLIRLVLELPEPPKEIILMIQKEVALRICARPPKMSLLSTAVQFYAEPKILFRVSKSAFWPRPKVDSAVIKITPHAGRKLDKNQIAFFFKILHAGFSSPRKQLLNNLAAGLGRKKEEMEKILEELELDFRRRPQTLDVDDWLKIAKTL